jgi:hypothetical protein
MNWDDNDSEDNYTYNNAFAAGSQIYPNGLSKYYDLFSTDGLKKYNEDRTLFSWMYILSFFTYYPWGLWEAVFSLPWGDNWFLVFFYPWRYWATIGIWPTFNAIVFNLFGTLFHAFFFEWYGVPWVLRLFQAQITGGWDVL